MRDTFQYTARWDSVGLDCSNCVHFHGPRRWPDERQVSCCKLHRLSLAVELRADGYKGGEWFCRDFENNGTAVERAAVHLESIRRSFAQGVLYGFYGRNGELKEIPFSELAPGCDPRALAHEAPSRRRATLLHWLLGR